MIITVVDPSVSGHVALGPAVTAYDAAVDPAETAVASVVGLLVEIAPAGAAFAFVAPAASPSASFAPLEGGAASAALAAIAFVAPAEYGVALSSAVPVANEVALAFVAPAVAVLALEPWRWRRRRAFAARQNAAATPSHETLAEQRPPLNLLGVNDRIYASLNIGLSGESGSPGVKRVNTFRRVIASQL